MDENAYMLLWRTREPILLSLMHGWWATGVDHAKLFRDRNVSYAVGYCSLLPSTMREGAVTEDGFCCSKIGTAAPGR
jgi:hypothetical protein